MEKGWNGVERRAFQRVKEGPVDPRDARKEKIRDVIFEQLVAAQILDSFMGDLSLAGIDEEVINQFEEGFTELTESQKLSILSVPAELRVSYFTRYAKALEKGEFVNGIEILDDMLAKAEKHGYTLGYHLSLYDIRPQQDGSWYVRGTEKDHRHNDIPMAYYSMSYSKRYRDKTSQYLYVVRAETGKNTSHYKDNDGSWGHAANLSIIEKINMRELEKKLAASFKETEKDGNSEGADT